MENEMTEIESSLATLYTSCSIMNRVCWQGRLPPCLLRMSYRLSPRTLAYASNDFRIVFNAKYSQCVDDSDFLQTMAHEMIHADRKHGLKVAAESNKVTLGALAVMILSGGAAAPMILAQVAQVAMTSAYTFELEAEADRLGLEALIQSGYSPTGMITLFEHFMAEEYKQPIHDYGIYMNHPDTPKRLAAAVKTLHDRKIPIQRKYALGLLRTELREESNNIRLLVDGQVVASGNKTKENKAVLSGMRDTLNKYLQLELAPYELHLVNGALYIENHFTAGNVKGITSPEKIRENLLRVINLGRAKHPTSKFFK